LHFECTPVLLEIFRSNLKTSLLPSIEDKRFSSDKNFKDLRSERHLIEWLKEHTLKF
jgi:hypothetical protein